MALMVGSVPLSPPLLPPPLLLMMVILLYWLVMMRMDDFEHGFINEATNITDTT
jgi:hypothetical protein